MGKVWTVLKLLLIIAITLIVRKIINGLYINRYAEACANQLSAESLIIDPEFIRIAADFKQKNHAPAVFFLNQHALKMTFNWLCNTKNIQGVHERSVFVTLDEESHKSLRKYWPTIRQYYKPTKCLEVSFNFGDYAYHTFFILRAHFAQAMSKLGQDIWFMQQDTVWRDNILNTHFESHSNNSNSDIIFDQIGFESSAREGYINGANFFVRAGPASETFFAKTGRKMTEWYIMDVGIWIHQCYADDVKCEFFPYTLVSCWEWLYFGNQNLPPYIIQMDADQISGKLGNMKNYGFYFVNEDGVTCNETAVENARENIREGKVPLARRESISRLNFSFYWVLSEILLIIPVIGDILRPYLGLLSYYLMMTV